MLLREGLLGPSVQGANMQLMMPPSTSLDPPNALALGQPHTHARASAHNTNDVFVGAIAQTRASCAFVVRVASKNWHDHAEVDKGAQGKHM